MKLILITLVMLLSACSGFQAQKNDYLSTSETAHELLTVTSSYMTDNEMANSLDNQGTAFSEQDSAQFKRAYSDDAINQALKQYVMENMPEATAKQAIEFYKTDVGRRYIAAMDAAEQKYYESPGDVANQILALQKQQDLMNQVNTLTQVMELESLMESILLNGMIRPLVQGMLLKQADQDEVAEEQVEAIAQMSLGEALTEAMQMIEGLIILSMSEFTQQEMTQINQYVASPVGLYENKIIAGAFEFALSQSSYEFGEMLAVTRGKRIVKSQFDMKGCQQTSSEFFCNIQSIGAYAESVEPLYLGSAVVGKTNQYRFMMTDSDWQQLNVKGGADDMLISKEGGRALISTQYAKDTSVDAKAYADKILGEIAKAIEADYHQVNLNVWPFKQNGGLFEVCYILADGQEVCKLAGAGQVGNDVLYIHAVFEPTDTLTDEVIRIISTAEPLN